MSDFILFYFLRKKQLYFSKEKKKSFWLVYEKEEISIVF
jgi:hypothetical protein